VVLEKPENPLVEFAKALEYEYALEDKVKEKMSEIRKRQTEIRKTVLNMKYTEFKELRTKKTKMINLEIEFDRKVLERLKQVRDTMNNDPIIQQKKNELRRLKEEYRLTHKENRTVFRSIKPLIS
jgi:phosphoribosylformylglycinamidine (FGAM) synthase PurS component